MLSKKWTAPKKERPKLYSDDAILTSTHYSISFSSSIKSSPRIFNVPSYTQICRRAKMLGQELEKLSRRNVTDIVINSTGLKVYGEGEWKVGQHGYSKRRTWRKLHLAVCPDTNEIVFKILTDNKVADCEVYPELIERMPKSVKRTYGDGASCYAANIKHGSIPVIPPNRNAVFRKDASPPMEMRNISLLEILGLGGDDDARKLWKKLKGYHRRSLAETTMFRFKQLFGNGLRNRGIETQRAESRAKCEALNIMTRLGMPESELIAA